ncbi:MAG: hypothetical protein L7U86_01135 [Rhodobacteraceae bacterium]|nr:hypothetical protein [Paracoccaceae bacterium]
MIEIPLPSVFVTSRGVIHAEMILVKCLFTRPTATPISALFYVFVTNFLTRDDRRISDVMSLGLQKSILICDIGF